MAEGKEHRSSQSHRLQVNVTSETIGVDTRRDVCRVDRWLAQETPGTRSWHVSRLVYLARLISCLKPSLKLSEPILPFTPFGHPYLPSV